MAGKLQDEVISEISSRLRDLPIPLPRKLGDNVDHSVKLGYLKNLLHKDPGVFLERYGSQLNDEERLQFNSLRLDDFEVDYYLKQLENADKDKEILSRNRRVALMKRLEAQGDFFSEEAMRHRAPELHKQHMGEMSLSSAHGPLEEGDMLGRLERQALQQEQRLAAQEAARQKQRQCSEEEEEEEEETTDEESNGGAAAHDQAGSMSPCEKDNDEDHEEAFGSEADYDDNFEMFLGEMKSRFLAGEDSSFIDYAAVDADASLDDDWAAIADQDAQEQYFDAD